MLVVAAIEHVAGLHDHELAADPAILVVDRTGRAQCTAGRRKIAMQIADRDEPLGCREPRGDLGQGAARDAGRAGSLWHRWRRGCRSLLSRVSTITSDRGDDRPYGSAPAKGGPSLQGGFAPWATPCGAKLIDRARAHM